LLLLPMAHIAGIPVEESLGMFAPVATVTAGVVGASLRHRWRRIKDRHARHSRSTERT
jgi:hypothetical protein